MEVQILEVAERELASLPVGERAAMFRAFEKLEVLGDRLPFPHQSQVKGADRLRELRPKSGRSPWRGLYRQIDDTMIVAAIGPEASKNPRGFRTAVKRAEARLGGM